MEIVLSDRSNLPKIKNKPVVLVCRSYISDILPDIKESPNQRHFLRVSHPEEKIKKLSLLDFPYNSPKLGG